jgi:hypothetical protein
MIPHLDLLGSLARTLHDDFVRLYYLMLPIFFMIAVVIEWFKVGTPDGNFIDIARRALICTLLLVAFQDISQAIIAISDGIADRIDNMSGLDNFLKMASEKTSTYSFSFQSLILAFDDLVIALLSYLSYFLLYIARYLTVAMYYFYWIFLSISAPLLLLFGLFRSTTQIPINLFRSMIEVASWKICWAILSAMLKALAFGEIYKMEGSYLTIIVLNFVIAVAMLSVPLIVRSLVGAGIHSTSGNIAGSLLAVAMLTKKGLATAPKMRPEANAQSPPLRRTPNNQSKSINRRNS